MTLTWRERPGTAAMKASGETLDPFQFDAAIRSIGEGGSKLIGDAYNTLMPLLDQSMIEKSSFFL